MYWGHPSRGKVVKDGRSVGSLRPGEGVGAYIAVKTELAFTQGRKYPLPGTYTLMARDLYRKLRSHFNGVVLYSVLDSGREGRQELPRGSHGNYSQGGCSQVKVGGCL